MIKFAFHCIAIAVVRLLGRVPSLCITSRYLTIVIDMMVTRRELSVSGSDTALPQMINLSRGVQCDGVCSLYVLYCTVLYVDCR